MKNVKRLAPIAMVFFAENAIVSTQSFTYQGKLTDDGGPSNGQYDLTLSSTDGW